MRRINIKVVARSKRPRIEVLGPNELKVHVTAPAIGGKANRALLTAVAEHFQVKPRRLCIVSGVKSPHKIIELNGSS